MAPRNEELAALYQLLEEMTLSEDKNFASMPAEWLKKIENWLMISFVITILVILCFAAWYRYGPDAPVMKMIGALHVTNGVLIIISLLYFTTISIGLYQFVRQHRKKSFALILKRLENDLLTDAQFLGRLSEFDKLTIEYGLLQYKHRWGIVDGRVSLLAGDIRKVGIFPAFAAAAISVTVLAKQDSSFMLWTPLILACCFYLVAFYATGRRERPDQVIALLELAIRQAKEHDLAVKPLSGIT
ncbi:hypothetical protein NY99_19805 [Xanthomonas phaseoli pv. phaseoli]|uniref:ABC transporter ATP-binding protein n=2 Tax=Xanthomonas cissicola TaxID=86186 RepID=A0ABX3M0H6_9XANT|nr:hypothetical protein [Xanthomonas phaseoli]KAB0518949.1 hypothetical protein F7R02_25325 [Xanthomonas cissicola]KGU51947.1 hypothetical protein NY99_19805 [Xanthomonas phaseoli pv. phaseoli]KHF46197.1 hypothetical protein QQ30_23100 [Xanthomonas phaseoli pv. phaseoli]KHS21910.1 hypothetical protein RM60_21380 [Xanthomonas phaseoli pv. phaseoli]OOW65091.1 hypothetical protein Xant_22125 [Xanthomonas cissicola]